MKIDAFNAVSMVEINNEELLQVEGGELITLAIIGLGMAAAFAGGVIGGYCYAKAKQADSVLN